MENYYFYKYVGYAVVVGIPALIGYQKSKNRVRKMNEQERQQRIMNDKMNSDKGNYDEERSLLEELRKNGILTESELEEKMGKLNQQQDIKDAAVNIGKLEELKRKGILTEEEFSAKKQDIEKNTKGFLKTPARIIFKRPSTIVGRVAKVNVFLDGNQICKLSNNDEFAVEVCAGKHSVYFTYTTMFSDRYYIDLDENEEITIASAVIGSGLQVALGDIQKAELTI